MPIRSEAAAGATMPFVELQTNLSASRLPSDLLAKLGSEVASILAKPVEVRGLGLAGCFSLSGGLVISSYSGAAPDCHRALR